MPLSKIFLVTLLLLISSFSGCMFLRQTKFTLMSLTVDDDDGFPRIAVQFNVSDLSNLILTSPENTILFSDEYYQGIHNESLYLAGYRSTVIPGIYTIKVVDASKNTIYENNLQFTGDDLSLTSLSEDQWSGNTGSIVVAFHLTVKNSGDLPAYPSQFMVNQGTTTIQALLLPTVILPGQSVQIPCYIPSSALSSKASQVNISLSDAAGNVLLEQRVTVIKKNLVTSWEYRWYYLGGNTLQIPSVEWLSDYYKGKDRFDILDYAAYVFDPFDDSYIEFLANQLLSLNNLRTDVEKINFVASFVQSIDYKKDDPENESYEYPRFPLETLKDRQGDCEDKAILAAALLDTLGYNVSLVRLPQHMAVGVHLNGTIPMYSYFIDHYYFLETTTLHMMLGEVPPEYQGLTNVTVYPISVRPLLIHQWKSATRYQVSTGGDYVRIRMVLDNLGTAATGNIEVRGAFYDNGSLLYNQRIIEVPAMIAGEERLVELSVDVPSGVSTTLKTQLYLDGIMVNQRESSQRFQ
jgi:hypothetical protein